MAQPKRQADGQTHHPPKSVEQQSEDSFPASDPPSFSGAGHTIGAPAERQSDEQSDGKSKKPARARDQTPAGERK